MSVVEGLDVDEDDGELVPGLEPLGDPLEETFVAVEAAGVGRSRELSTSMSSEATASTASTSPRLKALTALRTMSTLRSATRRGLYARPARFGSAWWA
jgi:hypothetical protein